MGKRQQILLITFHDRCCVDTVLVQLHSQSPLSIYQYEILWQNLGMGLVAIHYIIPQEHIRTGG